MTIMSDIGIQMHLSVKKMLVKHFKNTVKFS